MQIKDVFKVCPSCKQRWDTRDDLLNDPNVVLIGYQVHFVDLKLGLFYFNHELSDCKTTFTLHVNEFVDLYEGPVYTKSKMGDEDCPRYCLRRSSLKACYNPCECAFVRDIIQIIRHTHKEVITRVQESVL